MGMNGLLEIGKNGILAHQSSIAVAGHNIANVNTPGYSRQEAVLATTTPQSAGAGQVGTGVFVTTIRRDYDIFINEQLIQEGSGLGELSSRESALGKVEMLFKTCVDTRICKIVDRYAIGRLMGYRCQDTLL